MSATNFRGSFAASGAVAMAVGLALLALGARISSAHPLAPALLEIRAQSDGRAEVKWQTPIEGVPGSRLRPLLPSSCTAISAPRAATMLEPAAAATWTVECRDGLRGASFGVGGLDEATPQALLRVVLADGRVLEKLLTASAPAFTIPVALESPQIAARALAHGALQLARDPRPLLLVLGIALLLASGRSFAKAILAFVLAGTATLAVAALGGIEPPTALLDLGLALSLLLLAVELGRAPSSLLARFPCGSATAFGVMQGLCFADQVQPLDLPLTLLCFSAGIALAQVSFAFAVVVAIRATAHLHVPLPRWAPLLPAYTLGTLAVFWSLERATTLLP